MHCELAPCAHRLISGLGPWVCTIATSPSCRAKVHTWTQQGCGQHAAMGVISMQFAIGATIMRDALSAVLRTGQCGRSPAIKPACTTALPPWAPRGRNAAQHLAGKHAHPPWLRLAPVGLVVVAIWQGAEAVPALPKSCSLFRLEELFYQILRQSRGQLIGRQPIERAAMPPGKGESAQGRTECHKSVTWHPPLGSRNSSSTCLVVPERPLAAVGIVQHVGQHGGILRQE